MVQQTIYKNVFVYLYQLVQ